jgi:hypothetical protein
MSNPTGDTQSFENALNEILLDMLHFAEFEGHGHDEYVAEYGPKILAAHEAQIKNYQWLVKEQKKQRDKERAAHTAALRAELEAALEQVHKLRYASPITEHGNGENAGLGMAEGVLTRRIALTNPQEGR